MPPAVAHHHPSPIPYPPVLAPRKHDLAKVCVVVGYEPLLFGCPMLVHPSARTYTLTPIVPLLTQAPAAAAEVAALLHGARVGPRAGRRPRRPRHAGVRLGPGDLSHAGGQGRVAGLLRGPHRLQRPAGGACDDRRPGGLPRVPLRWRLLIADPRCAPGAPAGLHPPEEPPWPAHGQTSTHPAVSRHHSGSCSELDYILTGKHATNFTPLPSWSWHDARLPMQTYCHLPGGLERRGAAQPPQASSTLGRMHRRRRRQRPTAAAAAAAMVAAATARRVRGGSASRCRWWRTSVLRFARR